MELRVRRCLFHYQLIKRFNPSATLSLFLNQKLGFDPNISTALFHAYEFLVFSMTIIGAIIADNWLGIYKTLLSMSFVYAVGAAFLSVGTIDPFNLPLT